MKCKCKNEMRSIGSRTQEYDYTTESTSYYWCSKCGRVYSTEGSGYFSDPDILPKPKEIKRDRKEWCDCKRWKMERTPDLLLKEDENFCRFCGKKLHKTKLVDVELDVSIKA